MGSSKPLVAAGCAELEKVTRAAAVLLALGFLAALPGSAQNSPQSDASRLAEAQRAFDARQWAEAAELSAGSPNQPADFDFLRGLALAKLSRWSESRAAFLAGRNKAPIDPRFPTELAGIAYKQREFAEAKRELRAAIRLRSTDAYLREFLGTIYFLEGNLEAALSQWNRIQKPRLGALELIPQPRLRAGLRERAITFHPPQVLTLGELHRTYASLEMLGTFPHSRLSLNPAAGDAFDAQLHLAERNGFGSGWLESVVSIFSGAAYSTVYPEYYNIGGAAVNVTSLARWDAQKRRFGAALSGPLGNDPAKRVAGYFDARNENWNLSGTFAAPGQAVSDVNVRRFSGGAQLRAMPSGDWSWRAGFEVTRREFRNVSLGFAPAQRGFFRDSWSFSGDFGAERWLLRLPESRFSLRAMAQARAGRYFFAADPIDAKTGSRAFATFRGGLLAHWLPKAAGNDYEMTAQFRLGGVAGAAPLDELFQLGVERDNDLWLRGHAGTTDGRKGRAPLGRRFALANWELNKNIYNSGLFHVKLGPFLDSGAIADASGLFGSRGWQWDTGVQMKIGILGSVTVVLIYGRGLRSGRTVFFPTAVH